MNLLSRCQCQKKNFLGNLSVKIKGLLYVFVELRFPLSLQFGMMMMMRDLCSSSGKLLVALFLILPYCRTCKAVDDHGDQVCTSFCGDHSISSPFRLVDSPTNCGDQRYNLSCEQNQLVLYWQSGKYTVLSINYDNYTIRLRESNIKDLDSCSLPQYSLTRYNLTFYGDNYDVYSPTIEGRYENGTWLRYELNKNMIYVRCEHPLDSPKFVETNTCFNTSNGSSCSSSSLYSYVNVDSYSLSDLGLDNGCGIELVYLSSTNSQSWSCTGIRNIFLHGFELSWINSFCPNSTEQRASGHAIFRPHCTFLARGLTFSDILSILGVVAMHIGAKFVLGLPFVIALLIYKWRRRHLSMFENIEDFLQSDNNSIMPIRYSYRDIKKMTKGFQVRLGKGGYGSVFKGQLRSGRNVAVKILDKAETNGQDFINEVATLGRIHHVNVVHLIGYCVEGSKRVLIYEFMQNGSLDKYILSKQVDDKELLNLHQLYSISLDVARGIEYLHNGCDMQILHFDIKPHNILLNDNFIPKVSDFGLAKLYPTDDSIVSLTAARGTIGYMAPELFYKNVGGVSYKADVYSFGMLLMEMAGRRKNLNVLIDHSSQFYFPFWAYDQINEGNEISIEDATEEEMKVARKMMIVALWCIQTKPSDRPSMNKVVEMLKGYDEDLELPQKPYLYPQDLPETYDNNNSDSIERSKSSSHPSMTKSVRIVEGKEKESILPQKPLLYAQDSSKTGASDHLCSMPPSSSDPLLNNLKETSSFLTKEDKRSI